jgi:hypothetical protein
MTIENAKYMKNLMTDKVTAINCMWDGQYMSIPISTNNRHYQAILEWAKIDGNTIAEAD